MWESAFWEEIENRCWHKNCSVVSHDIAVMLWGFMIFSLQL